MDEKNLISKSAYFTDESQVLKIAISSCNFLGFADNHSIRKNDSFEAFQEILKKTKKSDLDFLILGGNMFAESSPSEEVLCRTISLLKEAIMGDKPINYEISSNSISVNYACENINIDLPIFVIQGKNEAFFSDSSLNVLDVLHAGNYVF